MVHPPLWSSFAHAVAQHPANSDEANYGMCSDPLRDPTPELPQWKGKQLLIIGFHESEVDFLKERLKENYHSYRIFIMSPDKIEVKVDHGLKIVPLDTSCSHSFLNKSLDTIIADYQTLRRMSVKDLHLYCNLYLKDDGVLYVRDLRDTPPYTPQPVPEEDGIDRGYVSVLGPPGVSRFNLHEGWTTIDYTRHYLGTGRYMAFYSGKEIDDTRPWSKMFKDDEPDDNPIGSIIQFGAALLQRQGDVRPAQNDNPDDNHNEDDSIFQKLFKSIMRAPPKGPPTVLLILELGRTEKATIDEVFNEYDINIVNEYPLLNTKYGDDDIKVRCMKKRHASLSEP